MRKLAGIAAIVFLIALGLSLTAASSRQASQPPPQIPPVFRGGISLVPVDVRVLDRQGKPITDLTQEDFTILENGVRQQVRHFSTQAFTPVTPTPGAAPTRRTSQVVNIAPRNQRIFLIVLGRGRLQSVAKGVDGVQHFVRDLLLPQDLVAVLAYNRATDFTADHTTILQIVEQFKQRHERIEADLKMRFSGLAAIYGGREIPTAIQREIDAVFGRPRGVGVRSVLPATIAESGRIDDDTRRTVDLLLGGGNPDPVAQAEVDRLGVSFDDFVATNIQSMQDLGNLYMGIEYLRHIEGEKHLLFVSETGLMLPRGDDDRNLANAASDARVAIDYIHTGGTITSLSSGMAAENRTGPARGRGGMPPVNLQPFQTARTLAESTGGQFYGNRNRNAAADLDEIDRTTRFEYLLGYYPSNPTWNGRFRRIDVRVNRPGAIVVYRHGYYARQDVAPVDRRAMLSYSRVAAAANYAQDVKDIALQATASGDADRSGAVVVEARVDVARIGWTHPAPGRNVAVVEFAVFCLDSGKHLVGQSWQTLELTYSDDRLEQLRRDGLAHTVTIPVIGAARDVKVVVYEYTADLVGSVNVKVQKGTEPVPLIDASSSSMLCTTGVD